MSGMGAGGYRNLRDHVEWWVERENTERDDWNRVERESAFLGSGRNLVQR